MGLLFLSVLSSKALVLPLQLSLGGDRTPSLRSIETCPGHEDDVMVVVEGTTDEEICMPGTSTINVHTRVKEDLPIDLKIKMDLKKIAPFPMTVPCLDGVGSCEYDICSYIENMSDILCPAFPAYQPCSCPAGWRVHPGGGGDPSPGHGTHPGGRHGGRLRGHRHSVRGQRQGQDTGLYEAHLRLETMLTLQYTP